MTDYDDIINLEHPTSKTHPRMSRANRAAQFAPFAALTGYEASISEEARHTDSFSDLGTDESIEMDRRMAIVRNHLKDHPTLTIVYFIPDAQKQGGTYQTLTAQLKKIDDYEHLLIFDTGEQIPLKHVISMESELFDDMEPMT